MLKSYIKITIRNIRKYRTFSFINISGLAIGITCSLLAFLFVRYELGYDRFHENSDRIFRLASRASIGDTRIDQTGSSAETFRAFTGEFTEIERGVKFLTFGRVPVRLDGKIFYEPSCLGADSTYFSIFTQPMIVGDPSRALAEPGMMVLSRKAARKYFGRLDVVGEVLTVDFASTAGELDFTITGVCEDLPENSHFHPEMVISSSTFPFFVDHTGWSMNVFTTYFLLAEGASAPILEEKMAGYLEKRMIAEMGEEIYREREARGDYWEYYLQPLTGIHLDSDIHGEFEANGNRNYVYMFMVISVVTLLIACFNFMNLSTARSSLRAKEVSIRKVVGSGRQGLVSQFLGESVILSMIAGTIGVAIAYLLLPGFRELTGRAIELDLFASPAVIPSLVGLMVLIGLISGIYPAFVLSSFNPVSALKGRIGGSNRELWIRNGLTILQFSIAIFLIAGVITVYRQMDYIQDKSLGFDKEHVLVIDNPGALGSGTDTFKEILKSRPGIISVSGATTVPGSGFSNIGFRAEGLDNGFTLNRCICDPDYLETMQLKLAKGRFFSRDFPSDSSAVVLNMAALELIGWDDPIGRKIDNGNSSHNEFHVIGVVEDYHYESLHQEIRPMALFFSGGNYDRTERFVSVRFASDDVVKTVAAVEKEWKDFVPGVPFTYSFLDARFDGLYRNDIQIRRLFAIFSVLAVVIGCLGLFGLSAFVVDRKTKEIGIRKVLGASVPGIVRHLNGSFLKTVLVANIFAWPVAWIVMGRWLQNFAYRIDLEIWVFLASGALAFLIALVTVSMQAVKAAMADPVRSLKYE